MRGAPAHRASSWPSLDLLQLLKNSPGKKHKAVLTGSALYAAVRIRIQGRDRGGMASDPRNSSFLPWAVRQVLPSLLFTLNAPLQPQMWMLGTPHNFWLKNVNRKNTFPLLPRFIPKQAWQQSLHFIYLYVKIYIKCTHMPHGYYFSVH